MEKTREKTEPEIVKCCKCGKIEYLEDTDYIYYDGRILRVCDACNS